MPILEITTGGVTTRGQGSLDVSAFFMKNSKAKPVAMHDAERDQQSGVKGIGSVQVTPSGNNMTNKNWVEKRNDFPDGCLIQIIVAKTTIGAGFRRITESLVLRPRDGAHLRDLGIICPTDQNSSRAKVYVIGRFDILTYDEIVAMFGDGSRMSTDYPIDPDTGEFDSEIFEDVIKEKGTTGPQATKTVSVKAANGKVKTIATIRRTRRIGLRT